MQTYAIKFHNRIITFSPGHTERTVFVMLVSVLAVSFALYLFFVGTTIVNIVDRKSLEAENRTLSSQVSELELKYFSESNKVDLQMAYSMGFKDATNAAFASGEPGFKSLTLAGNN